jgi:hypothetical protein
VPVARRAPFTRDIGGLIVPVVNAVDVKTAARPANLPVIRDCAIPGVNLDAPVLLSEGFEVDAAEVR